jgi:hypothetical protein
MSQKRVERKGEIFRMRSRKLLVRGWEGWGMRSSRKLKWIWPSIKLGSLRFLKKGSRETRDNRKQSVGRVGFD